jgi:hypothetical protein
VNGYGHSSILTWDNLLKRGFQGASLCPLCKVEEETLNHLLNTCHYTAQIWDQVAIVMRTSDRLRDSIIETISNWRDQAFSSPLLNWIWQLLPGFVLWQVWKERNNRIFRNQAHPWSYCWDLFHKNIMETLQIKPWSEADLACTPDHVPGWGASGFPVAYLPEWNWTRRRPTRRHVIAPCRRARLS